MNDFDVQYARLNKAQKDAVDTIEGPVMVIAGPGTGKTQILTLRIANILRNSGAGIGPENILALTFTNVGVVAMRERLACFIGASEAYRTNIFTFHSFCEEQIGKYVDFFPHITYARVATEIERIRIMETILHDHDLEILKTFGSDHHFIKDILWAIDQLKRESVSPHEFSDRIILQEKYILADPSSYYKRATKNNKKGDLKPGSLRVVAKNRELQMVYTAYQLQLKKNDLYDFTDMIMEFVTIAESNDEFASILREQYQYILVDEHQDTNDGQNRIIEILTSAEHLGGQPNLFTVGDDKQAIYRFQGASVENFLFFEKKFSTAKIIHLEDNYRSAQCILDEAHTVISSGPNEKKHQELNAYHAYAGDIRVMRFRDYQSELVKIAQDIHNKIAAGVAAKDIAVFYREHSNLRFIKEVFEKVDVPYVVTTKQNIFDNIDIRKILLLLRVIDDPMNDHMLAQVLLTDLSPVNIDDVLIILEKFKCARHGVSLYQLLTDKKFLQDAQIQNTRACADFAAFIKAHKENAHQKYFVEFFENLVRESGFVEMVLSRDDHVFLLRNMGRLFDEVRECVLTKEGYALRDFIMHLNTYAEYGLSLDITQPSNVQGVQLMTAHGSKGLEFEHVYITNVVHGLWGGKRQSAKFALPINTIMGDIEDERRLFYVAITRAKKSLTISFSGHDKNGRAKTPSVFIADLSARLIDVEDDDTGQGHIFFQPRLRSVESLISPIYMRERFLRTQLSATALNNYFASPVIYFFRNLVRLPSVPNKTMFYGSVLHATLERFFTLSQQQSCILSEEQMMECFDRAMFILRTPREYHASIKKRGSEAVKGYYQKYHEEFTTQVLLEKKITGIPFVLDCGEKILLTGVIDKLELHDKDVVVVDYKTGKPWSKYTKEKKEALKRQVVFYKLLLDGYNDGQYRMTQGVLDFIEPHPITKLYEKQIIDVNERDVEILKREINVFAESIMSGALIDQSFGMEKNDENISEYVRLLEIMKRHA